MFFFFPFFFLSAFYSSIASNQGRGRDKGKEGTYAAVLAICPNKPEPPPAAGAAAGGAAGRAWVVGAA